MYSMAHILSACNTYKPDARADIAPVFLEAEGWRVGWSTKSSNTFGHICRMEHNSPPKAGFVAELQDGKSSVGTPRLHYKYVFVDIPPETRAAMDLP